MNDKHSWTEYDREGEEVVEFCRKNPGKHYHNALSDVAGGSVLKFWIKFVFANSPSLANRPLGVIEKALRASPIPFVQSRGLSVAGVRRDAARLAAGRRVTGSWRGLRDTLFVRLPVLMYHHIGTPHASRALRHLSITPQQFERQMRWLHRRGYKAITPSQWLDLRRAGPVPPRLVMITIDDAYADTMRFALPILERFGFAATVFVITRNSFAGQPWEERPVMGPADLTAWVGRGMELGAHTCTHPDLTQQSDVELEEEIGGCFRQIAGIAGPVKSFAYPFGYVNRRVRDFVGKRYSIAFTCEEGLNDVRTDPLLMRRTMVLPTDSALDFALRVRFGRSLRQDLADRLRPRTLARKYLSRRLRSRLSGRQVDDDNGRSTQSLPLPAAPFVEDTEMSIFRMTGPVLRLWKQRFSDVPLHCGKDDVSGTLCNPDWQDFTDRATTADQLRIEKWLEAQIEPGSVILHVGFGNSSLASRFGHVASTIVGTTICDSEVVQASSMGIANYFPLNLNKYSTAFATAFSDEFDFIIDNNPSSFACCFFHFLRMMHAYGTFLRSGGRIVTDRQGLGWVEAGENPRWRFDRDDWSEIANILNLESEATDPCIFAMKRL